VSRYPLRMSPSVGGAPRSASSWRRPTRRLAQSTRETPKASASSSGLRNTGSPAGCGNASTSSPRSIWTQSHGMFWPDAMLHQTRYPGRQLSSSSLATPSRGSTLNWALAWPAYPRRSSRWATCLISTGSSMETCVVVTEANEGNAVRRFRRTTAVRRRPWRSIVAFTLTRRSSRPGIHSWRTGIPNVRSTPRIWAASCSRRITSRTPREPDEHRGFRSRGNPTRSASSRASATLRGRYVSGHGHPISEASCARACLSIACFRTGHSGTGTVTPRAVNRDLFFDRMPTSGSHEGKTVSMPSRAQMSRTVRTYASSASEFSSWIRPRCQSRAAKGTWYAASTKRDTAAGASRPRTPCSR
jgi:hypothetical protein